MDLTLIAFLAGAALCWALGVFAIWRDRKSAAHVSFGLGMFILGAEALLNGWSLSSVLLTEAIRWQWFRHVCLALLPGVWFFFSLCYGRGNYREFLSRWWPTLAALLLAPVGLVLIFRESMLFPETSGAMDGGGIRLSQAGVALHAALVVGAVLILMNLERTFRTSLGTMRWRIKYVVLGLGLLFVARIYTSSQTILYSSIDPPVERLTGFVLLTAGALLALSLGRAQDFTADIYPSHAVLYRSVVFVLAGAYLVVVGLMAQAIRILGADSALSLPLRAFLVLIGLVGLTVLLFSERVRLKTKRFVSRHFQRPAHDYRRIWTTFTEHTATVMDESEYCRKVVNWFSESFQVLSVTLWVSDADDRQLVFGASTSIPGKAARQLSGGGDAASGLRQALLAHPYPVDIDETREAWAAPLRQHNPDYFPDKGGNRVCISLLARGELQGALIVGDRVGGVPFTVEDFDLFKCIGEQIGASLLNLKLSKRLLQAKEMEAFQAMSAFFVHDLKNTAFTLSLLLQNLNDHFDDPDFRRDALRAVAKSVERINHLITRLNALRHGLAMHPAPTDLNAVVNSALAGLGDSPQVRITKTLPPLPKTLIDAEQVEKVLVNLLVNAREAMNDGGEIRIETAQRNGGVMAAVSDTGCGMTPEFMRDSLFRPFQTTKKTGIGIGMFHSKMIVDAHRGRLEVESEPGRGTTFRVWLPMTTEKT